MPWLGSVLARSSAAKPSDASNPLQFHLGYAQVGEPQLPFGEEVDCARMRSELSCAPRLIRSPRLISMHAVVQAASPRPPPTRRPPAPLHTAWKVAQGARQGGTVGSSCCRSRFRIRLVGAGGRGGEGRRSGGGGTLETKHAQSSAAE